MTQMRTSFEQILSLAGAGIVGMVSIIAYLLTLAPSVGFIDSGELAAVGSTLGIAHPTGYPLFTLMARLCTMVPVAGEEIVRLHIMSAVFTSGAMVVMYFVVLEFLEPKVRNRTPIHVIAAATASLFLALSQTVWRQGNSIEVYSLHILLIAAAMLFLLIALRTNENRWWMLFAYCFGLSFTNHLTTILLVPAVLYFVYRHHPSLRTAVVHAAQLSLPFAAGVSVYLFLPIRAANHPLLNWGDPQTWDRFMAHVSGKQFRVWMFSSSDIARKQLEYFFDRLPAEFYYIQLMAALAGVVVMMASKRKTLMFVVLLLVTCVAYSVNYDIHDIDAYFLLAYMTVAVFAAFGMHKIFHILPETRYHFLPVLVAVVLVGHQGYQQWNSVDQSGNYAVEDYTTAILHHLPPDAIILSYQWDYFISASYYYQHVKKIRPDVRILDKELFRRSWYFPQLEHLYPDLMARSRRESDLFLTELMKFENGLPYEYAVIEKRYADLLMSFVEKNIGEVPVFVTPEIEQHYTAGYRRVPFGLVYQLTADTLYRESSVPRFTLRTGGANDRYTTIVRSLSSAALRSRGMYEQRHNHDHLARRYFEMASTLAE